jgi:biopolymer transport protein ExbD
VKSLTFFKRPLAGPIEDQIELDLVPVMSVFLILLPFLVSMAVLTHLAILEFSVPPNVNSTLSSVPGEKPVLKLAVIVAVGYVAITRGEQMLDSIAVDAGTYDHERFAVRLALRRSEHPGEDEIIVASADRVRLKEVVAVMDACRSSGFTKVGLSSAGADAVGGGI